MLKSVVQWLRELPYEYYKKAWCNVTAQGKSRSMAERQTTSLSGAIYDAFVWANTPEGCTYWQRLYDKYHQQETSLNKDLGVPYNASEQPASGLITTGAIEIHRQVESDEMVRTLRHNGTYCDSAHSIQE